METYEVIGYIDALISIASYRESLEYYVKPELENKNGELSLDCEDIYHPLIKNPVKNSISAEGSVLLTGSNATGKSTFIKTVAINSILAQTIYTCCGVKYRSNYFKTYTSMALQDSLLNNESYFIVEIKSLKRILDNSNDSIPVLCFIDEILRGTNTIERIAASSQVLKHLKSENCLCFAATHDIELTDILKNHYVNYHFQEKIVDNKVIFDYKLYKGRTNSRNAIKLLEITGYDKKIVDDALVSIEEYGSRNEWLIL
jgi:DNA mismatch repair ATPase MutS